jgi:hypothetical protein
MPVAGKAGMLDRMRYRTKIGISLVWGMAALLTAGCDRKRHWREEVALSDGRRVVVTRDAWFGADFLNFEATWPRYYTVEFDNPTTHAHISWSGQYGVIPVMLDVAGQETYLVVEPFFCKADMSDYNNPNPPFAYLRYAGAEGRWKVVSRAEVPGSLRANLTPGGDDVSTSHYIQNRDIAAAMNERERVTDHYFQVDIPADLQAWRYEYKSPGPYRKCP